MVLTGRELKHPLYSLRSQCLTGGYSPKGSPAIGGCREGPKGFPLMKVSHMKFSFYLWNGNVFICEMPNSHFWNELIQNVTCEVLVYETCILLMKWNIHILFLFWKYSFEFVTSHLDACKNSANITSPILVELIKPTVNLAFVVLLLLHDWHLCYKNKLISANSWKRLELHTTWESSVSLKLYSEYLFKY